MTGIFIEAEAFENLGGWVVDSQSMAQTGSAYIMAHGMGIPVADAETAVEIPKRGKWTVWARTRDWTAVWKKGSSGGTFQVKVNEETLPVILGTDGEEWGWQKAGVINLESGPTRLALHDLTGFNGRCDALYLTMDSGYTPPDNGSELEALRGTRRQDDSDEYDLIVTGGGMAGICTAISAASFGAKVLLLQDRGILGGCNSSEIRVPLGGCTHCAPYPELGNVVDAISPVYGRPGALPADYYEDSRKENIFKLFKEEQCKLILNSSVLAVEKAPSDPQKINAVIAVNTLTGEKTRYKGKLFADCSGDAEIARMMGAETMYGREAKTRFNESLAPENDQRQVMGLSVLWLSEKQSAPVEFPDINWGIEFNEENCYYITSGDWECETGQYRDQALESEYIRDYGLMTTYANWSFLKNHSKRKEEWAKRKLTWVSYVGGKRESYRVAGDYVMTQNDIEQTKLHPDGTAAINWNIDLHFPDPAHTAKFTEPFRSCAYHRGFPADVPVPYRCLYSRDVKNLFIGGRIISVSHVAFAAVRVMRTLGMLGEVTGMAAAICATENCLPRDVYVSYFNRLQEMMNQGVTLPKYHPGGHSCETYHFKDAGHVLISRREHDVNVKVDPETYSEHNARIKELNRVQEINIIDGTL